MRINFLTAVKKQQQNFQVLNKMIAVKQQLSNLPSTLIKIHLAGMSYRLNYQLSYCFP